MAAVIIEISGKIPTWLYIDSDVWENYEVSDENKKYLSEKLTTVEHQKEWAFVCTIYWAVTNRSFLRQSKHQWSIVPHGTPLPNPAVTIDVTSFNKRNFEFEQMFVENENTKFTWDDYVDMIRIITCTNTEIPDFLTWTLPVSDDCPICMEPIKHYTKCENNHIHCVQCMVSTWKNSFSCPICRCTSYRFSTHPEHTWDIDIGLPESEIIDYPG
jgi:hypothetical protein